MDVSRYALERFDGQPWAPTRYTEPLTPGAFLSDGPRLAALLEHHWRTEDGSLITLDEWQRCSFNHLLERVPLDWPDARLAGRLRWRQGVFSMGRQNGKSLIGGGLTLYGLLQHVAGPSVIGLATSVDQANVVYQRAAYAVRNDPALLRRLKATGTRGIRRRDGSGSYTVKPAKDEGLQSVPITLGIVDELHLLAAAMWDSIVNGQRSKGDALVVGITTAGDESSHLLKRLYAQGAEAIEAGDPAGRFGFWVWEAAEGAKVNRAELDAPTRAAIEAANPAVACGRVPVERVWTDVRQLPEQDQTRYTLNRFVAASSTWLPLDAWARGAGHHIGADAEGLVVGVARTPSWGAATLAVAAKIDGHLVTELAASVLRPDLDGLLALCEDLATRHRVTFSLDGTSLSALGKALRERGHEVFILGNNEFMQASAGAWAAITQGRVQHAGDALTAAQLPHARRKNIGEAWRVVAGAQDADAVLATVTALWVAESKPADVMQLF